jgi:Ni/Fe-hydrogenase subunit HybB-like protein
MTRRQTILKSILWGIFGVLVVVTLARFFRGLGATTHLNETTPWGMWIAFDVMAGVALAAGGFVLAATVYIFGLEKYKEFTRPAILTAFLGYCAVAVGLLYDLGLPWHIYHPIFFPQPTSVLFEVAMCVILYLGVLGLEFAPVVLEHPWFQRPLFQKIHHLLKKATIPLVITGIALSTLHQSSLGSLFLIAPYRLHALWYSPIIWILFFVSAIGLGLMMVTAESYFSAWFFGHKLKMDRLAGLGLAAAFVLLAYVGLRVGDLAMRGQLGTAFDGSWQASLFLFEIGLAALLPALLLLFKRIRTSKVWLALCSGMVVLGMIGYRFDVCIVAFYRPENMPYFPSWMEIAVSVGIVATFLLVFVFFVEHLKVYPDEHQDAKPPTKPVPDEIAFQPAGMRQLLPWRLEGPRRYSMIALGAAALAVALLPAMVISGKTLVATPVEPVRVVPGTMSPAPGNAHELRLATPDQPVPAEAELRELMIIDANRDGRLVLFPHDHHAAKLGGRDSCGVCHHQSLPLDSHSACTQCHRDMYLPTDTFDHDRHVDKLGDVAACDRCHAGSKGAKTRGSATKCESCHRDMLAPNSIVKPAGGMVGIAAGYMDAMHGLCIGCHKKLVAESPEKHRKDFAECSTCHRGVDRKSLEENMPLPEDWAAVPRESHGG